MPDIKMKEKVWKEIHNPQSKLSKKEMEEELRNFNVYE